MKRPTLCNVQFLRFIAAGGVLFSHCAQLLLPDTAPVLEVPWTAGVDLFFVISGFIMAWLTEGQFGEPGAGARYLLRRMARIVPSYWFFTGLLILTVLLFGEQMGEAALSPVRVLTSFAFIPWPRPDGGVTPVLIQGWTLNYEAFFYACFAAALTMRRGLAWLAAAFAALVAIHPLVPDRWFVLNFYSDPIILEFLAGIALARLHRAGVRLGPIGVASCLLLALASYLLLQDVSMRAVRFGIPAMALAAGFILAPDPPRLGPIGRFLKFGGDASYTLYLSHTFTVAAVIFFWRSLGGGAPALAMAVAMASAVAAAMLFYKCVEAPFTQLLGRSLKMQVARGPASVAP